MHQQLPLTRHRFHYQCHLGPCNAHHSDLRSLAFATGKETKVWSHDRLRCWIPVSVVGYPKLPMAMLIQYSAVVASAARLGFQVVQAHDKNQTILLMTVSILAYVLLNSREELTYLS